MSAILPKITIHAKKKAESKINSSINQSIKIGTELTVMIQSVQGHWNSYYNYNPHVQKLDRKTEHVWDTEKILKIQNELLEKKTMMFER